VDGEPELGIRSDDNAIHAIGRLDDGERVRVVVREEQLGQTGEPTLQSACPSVLALAHQQSCCPGKRCAGSGNQKRGCRPRLVLSAQSSHAATEGVGACLGRTAGAQVETAAL
jgi:hypothetical protein